MHSSWQILSNQAVLDVLYENQWNKINCQRFEINCLLHCCMLFNCLLMTGTKLTRIMVKVRVRFRVRAEVQELGLWLVFWVRDWVIMVICRWEHSDRGHFDLVPWVLLSRALRHFVCRNVRSLFHERKRNFLRPIMMMLCAMSLIVWAYYDAFLMMFVFSRDVYVFLMMFMCFLMMFMCFLWCFCVFLWCLCVFW